MGQVIQFPKKYDPQMTYRELSSFLGPGFSVRTLRNLYRDGMPSCGVGYDGKRRFRLSEVREYLRKRESA